MQLNLNTQNHNPQFGMAIKINSSNFSDELSKRIKKGIDIQRLEKIFERANKNDIVDVYVGIHKDGQLWANLAERRPENVPFTTFRSGSPYSSSYKEGLISKWFRNPVNLIEDLVIKAEHKAEEIKSARKLADAIKKAVSEQ